MRMDLTVTNAAQHVLQPRCLRMVPAAHASVQRRRASRREGTGSDHPAGGCPTGHRPAAGVLEPGAGNWQPSTRHRGVPGRSPGPRASHRATSACGRPDRPVPADGRPGLAVPWGGRRGVPDRGRSVRRGRGRRRRGPHSRGCHRQAGSRSRNCSWSARTTVCWRSSRWSRAPNQALQQTPCIPVITGLAKFSQPSVEKARNRGLSGATIRNFSRLCIASCPT